jgi:hypothetical protein
MNKNVHVIISCRQNLEGFYYFQIQRKLWKSKRSLCKLNSKVERLKQLFQSYQMKDRMLTQSFCNNRKGS